MNRIFTLLCLLTIFLTTPARAVFNLLEPKLQSDMNANVHSISNVVSITDTNGNPITGSGGGVTNAVSTNASVPSVAGTTVFVPTAVASLGFTPTTPGTFAVTNGQSQWYFLANGSLLYTNISNGNSSLTDTNGNTTISGTLTANAFGGNAVNQISGIASSAGNAAAQGATNAYGSTATNIATAVAQTVVSNSASMGLTTNIANAASVFIITAPGSTNYYVSPAGADTNNGLSPSAAFATLSHAASVVPSNSTIVLTAGNNTNDLNPNLQTNFTATYIRPPPNTTIYGLPGNNYWITNGAADSGGHAALLLNANCHLYGLNLNFVSHTANGLVMIGVFGNDTSVYATNWIVDNCIINSTADGIHFEGVGITNQVTGMVRNTIINGNFACVDNKCFATITYDHCIFNQANLTALPITNTKPGASVRFGQSNTTNCLSVFNYCTIEYTDQGITNASSGIYSEAAASGGTVQAQFYNCTLFGNGITNPASFDIICGHAWVNNLGTSNIAYLDFSNKRSDGGALTESNLPGYSILAPVTNNIPQTLIESSTASIRYGAAYWGNSFGFISNGIPAITPLIDANSAFIITNGNFDANNHDFTVRCIMANAVGSESNIFSVVYSTPTILPHIPLFNVVTPNGLASTLATTGLPYCRVDDSSVTTNGFTFIISVSGSNFGGTTNDWHFLVFGN